MPQLRFRLVDEKDRLPLPGVFLTIAYEKTGLRTGAVGNTLVTDDGGRVAFDIHARGFRDLIVVIHRPTGLDIRRKVETFVGVKDLGDILIPAIRKLTLQITDEAGNPIPGAIAVPVARDLIVTGGIRRPPPVSAPSGPDGKCLLRVQSGQPLEVNAAASGFQTNSVVVGSGKVHAKIALRRSNRLEVTVLDANGIPKPKAKLTILGGQLTKLFPGDELFPPTHRWDTMSGHLNSGSGGPNGFLNVVTNTQGRFAISEITVGIPFEVTLTTDFGQVAESSGKIRLAESETRNIEFRSGPNDEAEIQLRIETASGTPIAGARIQVWITGKGSNMGTSVTSDSLGNVTLDRPRLPESTSNQGDRSEDPRVVKIRVGVQATGYQTRLWDSLELGPNFPRPFRIVMHTNRELFIRIEDDRGESAEAEITWLQTKSSDDHENIPKGRAQFHAPGLYRISRLRGGPVDLVLSVGGQKIEQSVPEGTSTTTVRLPRPGEVSVRWDFDLKSDQVYQIQSTSGSKRSWAGANFEVGGDQLMPRFRKLSLMPGPSWIVLQRWRAKAGRFRDISDSVRIEIAPGQSYDLLLKKKVSDED